MPDFQHRDMPGMFTRASLLKRELGFRAQILSGRFIMVSSADARAACERHYPSTVGRIFTVRFAVPPAIGVDAAGARRIADSYGLPERYVYMPNQFWRHKNHRLVIEALAMLRDQERPVTVVASGSQLDPRNPGHFELLSTMIRDRNLKGQFRILGMVPHDHVPALMCASMALLNPSHYEGWSTSVEEARSLGTALILSDIPVHREQARAEAAYFDPYNASELASILGNLVPPPAEAGSARRAAAAAAAARRVQDFSEDFAQVALHCAGTRSSSH
jgi:glycosyltransferase involved in cell wall biosynthesis